MTLVDILRDLLDRSAISVRLHEQFLRLLAELQQAKIAQNGWQLRYEIQGMFNTLELQGTVTLARLEQLNDALTAIWTPIARQWVFDAINDINASVTPAMPSWANRKGHLHSRDVWTDGVDYAYLDAPNNRIKLDRAEMHQMRIND